MFKKEIEMNKSFIESNELKEIANKVIENNKMDWLNAVRIRYLLVSPNVSKTMPGKIIKASDELQYFGDFDFLIEVSSDIYEKINTKLKESVIYHLLLHISVVNKEDGETVLKIVNHNIQDFSQVLRNYGEEWFKNLKIIMSSVYDLKPENLDNIKI